MQGSTATQIRVCNAATPLKSWTLDHAGFLRCKTSVLRSCVLTYAPEELSLENIPASLRNRDEVKLFVPEDELSTDGALGSLEGRPVSVDHIWQSTLGVNDVGNIAGAPTYDPISKMVFADILVTDPNAILRITSEKGDPGRLVEQSAGYLMKVDWTPGVTDDGEEYDGVQRNIQYNHVALVGEGEGRAGKDVRILNKWSCNKMADELVRVQFGDVPIRVHNADVNVLEKERNKKDDTISTLIDPKAHEKVKTELTDLRTKSDEFIAKNEEKDGQIKQLREMVDELENPQLVLNAANQLIQEREDTAKVYNSLKGRVEDSALSESVEKAKSLQGAELHLHVVTSHRAMNKKPDLKKEELENSASVGGRFAMLVELSEVTEKTNVSGGELMKTLNAKTSGEAKGKYATADARRKHFHDMQTGKS